jgi:hypothetical protein
VAVADGFTAGVVAAPAYPEGDCTLFTLSDWLLVLQVVLEAALQLHPRGWCLLCVVGAVALLKWTRARRQTRPPS